MKLMKLCHRMPHQLSCSVKSTFIGSKALTAHKSNTTTVVKQDLRYNRHNCTEQSKQSLPRPRLQLAKLNLLGFVK